MQKARYLQWATGLLVLVVVAACAPRTQTTTESVAPPPAQPQVVSTDAGVAPQAPAQPAAPLCQPSAATCTAPDIQDTQADNTYCQKKIPYQNILVPDGTTWEVLDKSGDYTCEDQNTFVEGKRVIACTGKELFSFQLKLSNPACGGTSLVTGTGQCQDGYGYDSAQQCCAPVGAGEAGAVTITVNMGACPLPQSP
jgi:hypothetical protein